MTWKHGRPKPVIGITGGIGAGKSAVARLFAREGCATINSDELSHEALQSAPVREALRNWLGGHVFDASGVVNRKAVAKEVFGSPEALDRLNYLIHPLVAQRRQELMVRYMADPSIRAVIWDTPLLLESGLERECDAIVFVKVPRHMRLERILRDRGWDEQELSRREKLQIPLDKKAQVADYCVDNSGDEVATLLQVQRVLSHLFEKGRF